MIISRRQAVWGLILKSLKEKYSGSVLGFFWSVLNPFFIMLAVSFVFTQIMKTDIKGYPLFILSALLPWFFFSGVASDATQSFKRHTEIMNQFLLPRETIPFSVTCAQFINFLFGLVFMLPIFAIFNPQVLASLFLLPLILLLHFLFTLGIAFLFGVINVYFRDFAHFLNVGLMFLFWVTPVFYPLEAVPQAWRPAIILNPGTCYMEIYRSILYAGAFGRVEMWLLCTSFSLASLFFGYLLFSRKEDEILKRL